MENPGTGTGKRKPEEGSRAQRGKSEEGETAAGKYSGPGGNARNKEVMIITSVTDPFHFDLDPTLNQ